MARPHDRSHNRLTALAVSKKGRGLYHDGGGLWLQVGPTGSKSWVFRFMLNGRARGMGLGPFHTIGLADARAAALECRRLLLAKIDPIDARHAKQAGEALTAVRSITFNKCAAKYIEAHRDGWRNPKHAEQWVNTLETYCGSVFGTLPVQAVDTALVLSALEPIWKTKTTTATRLRGRIENVLSWATVHGYREGENPARWKGHLDQLLARPSKVATVEHHAALPHREMGAFMADLRKQEGIGAAALEFAILTAARSGEVRGATWAEIDVDAALWTIPAARMKGGREHRVPLSASALAVLARMQEKRQGAHVFPGAKEGKPLSDMSLTAVLRRMERGDLTAHGFRSTFRDWASDCTSYSREVCEMALAHAVGNAVEAAYRRGDLFEKRRALMDDWQRHCETTAPGNVLSINARVAA